MIVIAIGGHPLRGRYYRTTKTAEIAASALYGASWRGKGYTVVNARDVCDCHPAVPCDPHSVCSTCFRRPSVSGALPPVQLALPLKAPRRDHGADKGLSGPPYYRTQKQRREDARLRRAEMQRIVLQTPDGFPPGVDPSAVIAQWYARKALDT
jgi:hypothetical protein